MILNTSALMGKYYDRFMANIETKVLTRRRQQLFSGLQGKILEIGPGTGINLDLFPKDTTLVGFEPNPYMLAHAFERPAYLESPERFVLFPQKTEEGTALLEAAGPFDALVCTLVLCTVEQPEALIRSLLPYLKADAKIIVLEHIVDPQPLIRWLQKGFNPVWKRCAEGCHLTRPTDQLLHNMGFNTLSASYFRAGLTFYQAILQKP